MKHFVDRLTYAALLQLRHVIPSKDPIHFRKFQFIKLWYFDTLKYDVELLYKIDQEYSLMAKFQWNNINIRLSKSDRKKVHTFVETMENDLQSLFDILADDEIKTSLVYSEKQSAWCVTFTRKQGHQVQDSSSISSWSNDPIEALWMTAYKHIVISSRKVWVALDDDGIWG